MERLTEEKQIGQFASLKDKAETVPGAFGTYDCLYAHMVAVTRLKQYEDTMSLERAQEFAQAEKDGRLVVLPCKVGDMLYEVDLPTISPPPNDPLTLEQLREMVGNPVYIERYDGGPSRWAIVGDFESLYGIYFGTAQGGLRLPYDFSGKTWLAYRRKSEEGET